MLTNSPGFEWQLTNLNNYVNLFPGTAPAQDLGTTPLKSFGAGSGFLGIPGDVTPPSRFVRAAFYQSTAPLQDSAEKTVLQGFQILNNFDIPVGIEFPFGKSSCRHSKRYTVDIGYRYDKPNYLLPHHVQQCDTKHRLADH